jgi:protein-S-isoprenylcysteine O-methyltransferase Ste14
MPGYFAALTIVLLLGMVLTRVLLMKKKGIEAMNFGKQARILPYRCTPMDRSVFLPWWAGAFSMESGFFREEFSGWHRYRARDKLVTSGVFAFSRNPIDIAIGSVLPGQFLIFSNWILLIYLGAAIWLFHRQVLREEDYLKKNYGEEYAEYCNRVRRYF